MTQRRVVITGANSGIGKAAAVKFASNGYEVIMGCRNIYKAREAKKDVISISGNEKVSVLPLDTSSFDSIKEFCRLYAEKYDSLDVLINNAAYFDHGEKKFQFSTDNLELCFATNVFGPWLLSMLLKDLMVKSGDPRILNASSTNIKHFYDPKRVIEYDNLRGELKDSKPYNVYKLYGDSKMALLMVSNKMAEEFGKDGIKVNSVLIPAIKQSRESMRKFRNIFWRTAAYALRPFARPPEAMAETYFRICTSAEYGQVTGRLINIKGEIMDMPNPDMQLDAKTNMKQLWRMTIVPQYAVVTGNIEKIWQLCKEFTA